MGGAAPRAGDAVEASSAMLVGLRVGWVCEGTGGDAVWFLFSISRSFAKATSFAFFPGWAADIGCSSSAGRGVGDGGAMLLGGACTSCFGSSFELKMEANLDLVGFVATTLPSAALSFSNFAKNLSTWALGSGRTLGGFSLPNTATSFWVGSGCAGFSSPVVLFFIFSIHCRKSSCVWALAGSAVSTESTHSGSVSFLSKSLSL